MEKKQKPNRSNSMVSLSEKYTLTVTEATKYFGIEKDGSTKFPKKWECCNYCLL